MHLTSVSYDDYLADVKRNCTLDVSEPDARLRILTLQTSYIELCERRGWKFFETAQKAAIKHLCAVLQPPELKTRVVDALKLEKHDLEEDFFGFVEFLADEAEVCEKFRPLRLSRSSAKNDKKKKEERSKSNPSSSNGSATSGGKADKKQPPPCLNPNCSQKHLLKH